MRRAIFHGVGVLAASAMVALASTAHAHHSAAMFDDAKVVEVRGMVKELQWTNPHVWLQVLVPGERAAVEWSIEGGSPNSLSRQGWRSTTFNAGDIVVVRISPMKDGTPGGSFIGAQFEDGHTIGRWE